MEILTKKTDSNSKGTITKDELILALDLKDFKKQMAFLQKRITELDKLINNTKNPIEDSNFIKRGEVYNISHAASIEKDSKLAIGSIYYNKTLDKIRIKTNEGWKNLILE